jgi:hypothetical protein
MSAMAALIATIVDTDALLQTMAAALIAGVGVALTFSLAILGATGFAEASRDGRSISAAAFAALGLLGLLATAAAIAAAIIVMTSG